jgi:hypothetical protein
VNTIALSRRPSARHRRSAVVLSGMMAGVLLLPLGCSEPLTDVPPPTRLPGDPGFGHGALPVRDVNDGPVVAGECGPRDVPVRRVSHFEHRMLLQDLLPGVAVPSVQLATDLTGSEFDNQAEALIASPLLVNQYHSAAQQAAEAAVANVDALLPCSASDGITCAEAFIRTFGRRALRRPLTEDDVALYRTLFENGPGADDFNLGVQLTVQAFLESPEFLYRVETGVEQPDGTLALDGYSLASRLSFLLWSSMPDDALFEAAEDGSLLTDEGLAAQVERMLDDEKARRMMEEFFRQWLDLERVAHVTKDDPAFTSSLQDAMREESVRFLVDTIFDQNGTMADLLTSRTTWVNQELADLYGVQMPAETDEEGWAQVELGPERSGFLTQGTFLAGRSHPYNPSPVLRGVLVLERLICLELGAPPPGAETTQLDEDANPQTNRESYDLLTSPVECNGCHQVINPIGFALEEFDTVGRHRTTDNGVAVDLTGSLLGESFDGASSLGQVLANLPDAEHCLTEKMLEYTFGAKDDVDGSCMTEDVAHTFMEESDGSLRSLLVQIATHPDFRQLRAGGGAQ